MDAASPNHSLTVRVLASGSGGNSILICSGAANILIDAGLSCRELERRLAIAGESPAKIAAVFVTHEHLDHVRGVGVLSRRYGIPIYLNRGTRAGACSIVGEIPSAELFKTGDLIEVGGLGFQTYPVLHDAADPVGVCIHNSSRRIGIALDMGYPTKLVKQRLCDSNMLILEFNHDPEMLRHCNRPWELKQRILSKTGHMSNEAALALLGELVHDTLHTVVLAHISREANCADHALSLVDAHLKKMGRADIRIFAGDQDEVGLPIPV
ncbi:MAG: MBL fold metallo-hydrolase [Candidatus Abyssobacteria bacterium SURF_5]|uniref:MBL fold metallo-hydrolase n=1 Tax=Abyssobacteria bacterium (strain SURF_5) TaxID=2093360 RepID=A0A3A4NW36_ABYX5|nr:MAG: MBL fold metallo-hydrolase [Candidatus Abyssubacteria bacterium SURF_5]